MNKSIYKKQLAFKNSLPQYGNGGKKFAAGLAGFASGLPGIGPVIGVATANTPAVKDNPVATKAGKFGATVLVEGTKMALNPMSAISGAPKIIGEGLDLGSTVAEEKGNTQRADRLDTAAMGMQGVGQIAGMATGMAGQFGGEGGFNPMQMFGGNTPVVMKNGGSIPKYPDGGSIHIDPAKRGTFKAQATRMGMGVQEAASKILNAPEGTYSPEMRKKANFAKNFAKEDGGYIEEFKDGGMIKRADGSYSKRGLWDNIRANKGSGKEPTKEMLEQERKIKAKMRNGGYTYSTEADKQGSNYNVKNPSNTSQFVEPKKKVLSEVEKKLMQQQVVQEDGTVTDGLGNIIRTPEQKSTGAIKESESPLDLIGSGIYSGGIKMLAKGLNKAGSKLLPNAYKINPTALKDNPEMFLYRARPVGQNVDMNMAAQLKAKESAGEPLTWYQKNLINPQTNPQMLAREKYYGQWFEKDPSRLDFYINPGTRNFSDNDVIEILRTKLPKTEASKLNVSQFPDAKVLSASPETEFILPKDMISSAQKFPESSLQQLIQEDKTFNTPHWLKGYKKENGGPLNKSNKKDLIKYNGATHENSPIGGIPIAENGQQLHSGFKSQIPANTKAFAEHGEAYSKDKEYIFSHNPEFKDMNGKTPADKIKAASQIIKGRENDSIAQNSYKRMEARIIEENENMRMKKEIKSNPLMMAKNGGNLPKYNDGAYFNPYGLGSGTVNTFGTTPTESMNTMTPSVMLGNTTIPSIKDRSNKNFTNTNTETINSSLFPTKNRFAPATMNNPNLAGNKTNPNLLPINNPVIPTQSGMSQRRAVDFGANFDRNSPFKADKADTGSIFSQPGVAGGALKNVPSTLYNLGVGLFGKVQKTPPVLTQRTEKIGPVRFGTNEMDLEANRQMAAINQGSTSDAVRRANLQSLSLGNQRLKGELTQKEALANVGIQEQNQARALQENLTDQKAIQLAQQLNISAEQAKKLALQEGIAGIGEIMDDTSKQKIAYGENQLGFGALQTMFSNWKLKNPGGTYSSFLKSIGKGGGAIEFVS